MTGLTYFPVSGDFRNVNDPDISGSTNTPQVEIISGLVTFHPRLPDGFVCYVDNFDVVAAVNEVQQVTVGNSAGGTFTLSYISQTTSALAYNASAATVQTALEGLSTIQSGNVNVTGPNGGPWLVEFTGTLAAQVVDQIITNGSSLTPPDPTVTITTATLGEPAVNEVQLVTVSNATGGAFTLTYAGQTTGAIAWNATAATVQTALQSLSNIGTNNCTVTGVNGGPYTVTFVGGMGGKNVWTMNTGTAGLTGSGADVSVTTVTSGQPSINAVQTVVLHNAIGGTFTLTFNGQTTAPLLYNASVTQVQTALEGLSNINVGDCLVSGISGSYNLNFQGNLAGTNVPALTASSGSLEGETPTSGVYVQTLGQVPVSRAAAVAIPQRNARIWNGTLSTINVTDTAGIELVSNTASLGLAGRGFQDLIYDVEFTDIQYAENSRQIDNFAFVAPADGTAVNITDPDLARIPYFEGVQRNNIVELDINNIPDDVVLTGGGEVQFMSNGVPLGDPLALTVTGGGGGGSVTFDDITDATTIGKSLGRATTATNARTAIGAIDTTTANSLITTAVNALVNGAPGALDTLKELADALGDDPTFATDITNMVTARALDSAVVHLAGTETVTGSKNFTGGLNANSNLVGTRSKIIISTGTTLGNPANHEFFVLCQSGAVPVLPTAVSNSTVYIIKNISGGNITVSTTSSQTIEGATTYTLADRESITLISDTANWGIV